MPLGLTMELRSALKDATRIAVLCVGSELRGDDRAGLLVARLLSERCTIAEHPNQVKVFLGATAPENLTGEIRRYSPSHLIMIDAVDSGKPPGSIEVINSESISGVSFSTHLMPLGILIDYLRQAINCNVVIVGIQPKTLEFDALLSPEVESSVRKLVVIIEAITRERVRIGTVLVTHE